MRAIMMTLQSALLYSGAEMILYFGYFYKLDQNEENYLKKKKFQGTFF